MKDIVKEIFYNNKEIIKSDTKDSSNSNIQSHNREKVLSGSNSRDYTNINNFKDINNTKKDSLNTSLSHIELDDEKKKFESGGQEEDAETKDRFKKELNEQHKFVKRFIIDDNATNKI